MHATRQRRWGSNWTARRTGALAAALAAAALAAAALLGSPAVAAAAGAAAKAKAGPAPEERRVAPVLTWSVGHPLWGALSFTILPHGYATYDFKPARKDRPPTLATKMLSAAQLKALESTLRKHGVCTIVSKRKVGIPDESRPTLSLSWKDLRCAINLWDGEWRDMPRAKEVSAALVKVMEEVEAEAKKAKKKPAAAPSTKPSTK